MDDEKFSKKNEELKSKIEISVDEFLDEPLKLAELMIVLGRSSVLAGLSLIASIFILLSTFLDNDFLLSLLTPVLSLLSIIIVAFLQSEKNLSKSSELKIGINMASIAINVTIPKIEKLNEAIREIAISVTYLNYLRKKNYAIKLALAISAVFFSILNIKYPMYDLLSFAAISGIALSLLLLKEFIIGFRIKKGFFGSTREEARTLVDFIFQHSEDIDFTDGNGKLRKALLPESKISGSSNPEIINGGVIRP